MIALLLASPASNNVAAIVMAFIGAVLIAMWIVVIATWIDALRR